MRHGVHDKGDTYEENPELEIAKSLEQLEATEKAILERFGGSLSERQKESLGDLLRLDHSLRGPDETLDQELYSRAVPPHHKHNHNKLDQ
jgi:hypothetical protein